MAAQPSGFIPDPPPTMPLGFLPDAPPDAMAEDSHQSRIGPTLGLSVDPTEVTLGELMENPRDAITRIGANLRRDVSDPNLWASVVLSYFGPKAASVVMPAVGRAIRAAPRAAVRGAAAVGDVISPDVVGVVSPRLGRVLDVAQRLRNATPTTAPPAPPSAEPVSAPSAAPPAAAPPAGPVASPPEPPVPPAAPATAPSAPTTPAASQWSPQRILNEVGLAARRAKVKLTTEQYQQADQLVAAGQTPAEAVAKVATPPTGSTAPRVPPAPKVKVSAAEMRLYDQFRQRGHSHQEAIDLVLAQQELATRLRTPTAEQVRRGVAERNLSGRWPE